MADDIEDLLREVEEKYLPRPVRQLQEKNSRQQPIQPTTTIVTNEKRSYGDRGDQSATGAVGMTTTNRTTTRAHSSDIV